MHRDESKGGSEQAVAQLPRTTLSFLIVTLGVAMSSVLGLTQADASVVAEDAVPPSSITSQSVDGVESDADALDDPMMSALGRFGRQVPVVNEPNDDVATTTIARFRETTTGVDDTDDDADTEVPTTTTPVPTSSTKTPMPSTSIEKIDEPTAVRDWLPISSADFRRFAETRPFTTMEYVTPALVHGTITGANQRVNVVLVHRSATEPMRVSPAERSPEPVGAWAETIGATAGINANWYDPFDGPAVSGGRVYGGLDHGYTALFGFTETGDLVADHHHKIHDRVDPGVAEAVAGHPSLIHRGVSTSDFGGDSTFTRRHPRTAIGVTATVDILILVTVDGRRSDAAGMTGAETTRLMRQLGAHDAVMLDGGGSSALWIAGRGIVNRPSDPGRAVGNQIAVFGR